jgi:site-specific recombinase
MISQPGIKQYLERIPQEGDFDSKVRFLRGLVDLIRPRRIRHTEETAKRIAELSALLDDPIHAAAFSKLIDEIIEQADFTDFFIESGIPSKSGFFAEIMSRFRHKLLPSLHDPESLDEVFARVFYKKSDYKWITALSDETWKELFAKIHIGFDPINNRLFHQIINALTVCSYRIAFYGTDTQITHRIGKDTELQTCFLEQNKELLQFMDLLKKGTYDHQCLRHAIVMLNQCAESLEIIRRKSMNSGTSLNQNFLLRMLQQLVRRALVLSDFMNDSTELGPDKFILFFKQSVVHENTKNDILRFISSTLSILSYQIAEHKGRIGEHYITTTRSEYFKFFMSSCGGGFIVSFLVILKILLHHAHLAPFWEALSYSLNYAIGFVLIQVTGSALATKQPAMTASAIASSMDTRKEGGVSLFQLAVMVAKVCRSQTISFAGNLLLVFPFTLLWVYLYERLSGLQLVDQTQAAQMLRDIHPYKSLSFFYAALTGLFLFVSSVISGYVDNQMLYGRIAERLRKRVNVERPGKARRINRLINYLDAHSGSLSGNVVLGFLLGTAGLVGHIFGLPYDIRHITFSTGNMAIGLHALNFSIGLRLLGWCLLGIFGIGLVNFLVSFLLALYVAIKSRNINIRQYSKLSSILFRYWLKRPLHFIYPPSKEPEEELLS